MSQVDRFDPNPVPRGSWFSRNWLWFMPLVIFAPTCICCLSCGGLFAIPLQAIKSSEPYQMALEQVRQDPEVREALGEPIEEAGFMPTGNVNVYDGYGHADLYFKVRGPKGDAHVRANAQRENSIWTMTSVEVTPADGSRGSIILTEPPSEAELDMELMPTEMPDESESPTESDEPADEEPADPSEVDGSESGESSERIN